VNEARESIGLGGRSNVVVRMRTDAVATERETLKNFFPYAFDQFDVEGKNWSEILLHGRWVIEIDEIRNPKNMSLREHAYHSRFRSVFVFSRQLDDSSKIARVIALED
jgi:hypothetical protein